jgi:SAM-dependent methyltransferase
MENVPCPLCGSDSPRLKHWLRDEIYPELAGQRAPNEQFRLVACTNCDLLYLSPRPSLTELPNYYPDLDYHAFKPATGITAKLKMLLARQQARALLRETASQPALALEVGCGTGGLLGALQREGSLAFGLEPNQAAVAVAQAQGLTVTVGSDDTLAQLPANYPSQFDLIVLKYVLEHVPDPLPTLQAIAGRLRPNGRAVLWLPNAQSWDCAWFGRRWRGFDSPRHLLIFTPATIRAMAAKAGLTVEAIGYSPLPNDFVGSFAHFWRGKRGAWFFGPKNPLGWAAWLPVSALAARMRRSGRIRVVLSANLAQ